LIFDFSLFGLQTKFNQKIKKSKSQNQQCIVMKNERRIKILS